MSNSVADRVIAVISNMLRIKHHDVKPESLIEDELGADSLDCIEILMEIESEFDISISDDEAMPVRTVQDAIDLVNKLI